MDIMLVRAPTAGWRTAAGLHRTDSLKALERCRSGSAGDCARRRWLRSEPRALRASGLYFNAVIVSRAKQPDRRSMFPLVSGTPRKIPPDFEPGQALREARFRRRGR